MQSDLEIRKKIGQILMFGFDGTELHNELQRVIEEQKVGAFILFARNITDPKQLKELCQDLQEWNKTKGGDYPLLISVDQEGGHISRIPWLKETYPDPILLSHGKSTDEAYLFGYGLGRELSQLGINVNLAPVLDVLSNPENTLLAKRCLGKNALKVAALGNAVIKGLHRGGVLATGKHFPGHGDVTIDSHCQLPISHSPLKILRNRELIPFKEAIGSGLELIMTAHVKYTDLDPEYPATLSQKIIQNLLRQELNFQGLVITDDLLMKAITNHYSLEDAAILAIKAGADILLVSSEQDSQNRIQQTLVENYQDPEIRQAIELAYQRIIQLKTAWNKIFKTLNS